MDITPLHIHSVLMNCFNKVIFLRFCEELKFHIFPAMGPGIKISISSKRGRSTFVLSTVEVLYEWMQMSCVTVVSC